MVGRGSPLPKVVSLNDLRRMGKLHLVDASDVPVLAHSIKSSSDEHDADIGEILPLHKLTGMRTDSLYEAQVKN
jgi:hypothetical protein